MSGKVSIEDMLSESSRQPETEAAKPAPAQPGRAVAGTLPAVEDSEFLPTPGDPYKAHARQSQKPEPTLHVIHKDGSFKGVSWSTYDSIDLVPGKDPGSGPEIVLRFAGILAREVRITGRNLGRLHVYLGQQRVAWIRELPEKRGFLDPGIPVITGVVVKRIEGPF